MVKVLLLIGFLLILTVFVSIAMNPTEPTCERVLIAVPVDSAKFRVEDVVVCGIDLEWQRSGPYQPT